MKIQNISSQSVMELIGSEASDAETKAMRELLLSSGFEDSNDIPENKWNSLLLQAIRTAKKNN